MTFTNIWAWGKSTVSREVVSHTKFPKPVVGTDFSSKRWFREDVIEFLRKHRGNIYWIEPPSGGFFYEGFRMSNIQYYGDVNKRGPGDCWEPDEDYENERELRKRAWAEYQEELRYEVEQFAANN